MSSSSPLVPAEVDLRGLPFMPLDTARLIDSDLFALSNGEEFKFAVALWCKSWTQQPAASLPNDDRVLAHLSGAHGKWKRCKPMAMRGWILCDDDRFYHPVVAEKALEAWEHRVDFKETVDNKTERQRRWRERLKELSGQLRDKGITPPRGASLETLEGLLRDAPVDAKPSTQASTSASTVDGVETGKTGTGTGTGTGTLKPQPLLSSTDDVRPPLVLVPPTEGPPPCPHEQIVEAWHRTLPMLARVKGWSETRREHLGARWKKKRNRQTLDWWERLFVFISHSPWLIGEAPRKGGERPWRVTLPWIVESEEHLLKIIEGNYHEDQA